MGCTESKTLARKVSRVRPRKSRDSKDYADKEAPLPQHYSLKEHLDMQLRSSKRHHSFRNSERAIEQIIRNDAEVSVEGIVSGWDASKLASTISASDSLRVLSVEVELGESFNEEALRTLVTGVANSTSIEEFKLIGAGNCGASVLGEVLATRKSADANKSPLKSVHLVAGAPLTHATVRVLARGLCQSKRLHSLRLAYLGLDERTVHFLAREGLAHSKSIRELDLSGNDVTDEGLRLLCQSLPVDLLSSLCLRNNHIRNVGALLGTKVHLERVYLGRNELGNKLESVAGLLRNSDTLQILELECNQIGVEGCQVLSTGLVEARRLTELNLSANPIGDEGLRTILSSLPKTIKAINLRNCKLTSSSAKLIADSLVNFPGLRSITLSENPIGEAGLDLVLKATKQHLCLERIAIDRDVMGLSDAIVPSIMKNLAAHRSMRTLSLLSSKISATQVFRVNKMLQALQSNRAKMMTALVAPLWITRIRQPRKAGDPAKCFIGWLPVELFRLLCDILYD